MTESFPHTDDVYLCDAKDVLDGEPFAVHVPGKVPIAVFRIKEEIYVTDNRCTHGEALLTDGFQEGERVVCPLHGGEFNVTTGAAVELPCHITLRTHRVKVLNDKVFLLSSEL